MSCVIGEAISSFLSLVSVTFSTEYVLHFELEIGNAFAEYTHLLFIILGPASIFLLYQKII